MQTGLARADTTEAIGIAGRGAWVPRTRALPAVIYLPAVASPVRSLATATAWRMALISLPQSPRVSQSTHETHGAPGPSPPLKPSPRGRGNETTMPPAGR